MRSLRCLALRLLALLVLLAGAAPVCADTPIALWKSFDGRVNFTGTQVTLRTRTNSTAACTVALPGVNRTAVLTLPSGATVQSAQLYWAGSGISDSTVKFEGKDVTASRKYTSSTVGNGFNYFGGAADVTAAVKAKGGGTYNFSGLTVANGSPWCASQGVLGGFSLLVVYTHPDQPERVLNLYEGFRHFQNSELVVSASNFRWNRTRWAVQEKARVGHITWEGDPTLAQEGERLLFEGTEMTDSLNPEGNQFNSRSNINNDSASYGIDFDAYDTSVTIWAYYDATVTTRYRAGQDMVILNAEILVVPTMPVSDLSIALVRLGALKVGSDVQYTVTVTNNGPYSAAGPITVTNTLPAGMTYAAGSGTGWACTGTASAGSCVYKGPLASGASAPPLVVRATVRTSGDKINSVTVKGTDDDNLANNTATDTATAPAPVVPPPPPPTPTPAVTYAFTDKACTAGVAIGKPGQACAKYSAATVGGKDATIYLTALVDGVPNPPSTTGDTTASLQFRLECVNPDGGQTGARYAEVDIPACPAAVDPEEKWSKSADIVFARNTVSLAKTFFYGDIGRIRLHLQGGTGMAQAKTEEFVSAPVRIAFKSIKHGTTLNPGHTMGDDKGFAPAGASLTLEIGALLQDGKYAPNFGNERPALPIAPTLAEIGGTVKLDSPGTLTESGVSWDKGIRTSTAAWSEVGAINFVTRLLAPQDSYLGVEVLGETKAVGRFYPAYFKTAELVVGPFGCPASLDTKDYPCPREANGAVYSGQSFNVTVEAYNEDDKRVQNFNGGWFKKITLHAVDKAGGAVLVPDLTPPTGETETTIAGTTSVKEADGETVVVKILGPASYKLALGYSKDKHSSTNITDPTTVYLRAVAFDANLAGEVKITSERVDENSDEGGIMVLNGRVAVPNALGSDILRTPLRLRAEYWAGATAGWLFQPGFADTLGAPGTSAKALVCSKHFLTKDLKPVCDTKLAAGTGKAVTMAKGAGVLWLVAPGKLDNGAARSGSYTLQYDGWGWLPSTIGRVSFGSHRSPVIYVREVIF